MNTAKRQAWEARNLKFSLFQEHLLKYFDDQVERTPEAIAIAFGDQYTSYQELQARAYCLAHELQLQGVGDKNLTAIFSPRNITTLIAILAVFKAGGTFLSLDVTEPPLRLAQILKLSHCQLVLTPPSHTTHLQHVLSCLPAHQHPSVLVYDDYLAVEQFYVDFPLQYHLEAIAYVIYMPDLNAATVDQRKMLHNLSMQIEHLQLSAEDCVAEVAPLGSDASVWQYLAVLLVGGKVEVIPDEILQDSFLLIEHLMCRKVSILEMTPQLLPVLIEELQMQDAQNESNAIQTLSSLRKVISSGEAFPPELYKQWSQIGTGFIPQHSMQEAPLSFAQERQWVLNQIESSNPFYNIPISLPLPGNVNVSLLEQSLQEIVRRHATLRTTFAMRDGVPVQVIAPPSKADLLRLKVVRLPASENEVMHLAYEEARRPFDLVTGPLVRTILFLPEEQDALLLLNIHHSVFDGWSIDILLRELAQYYQVLTHGEAVDLTPLPIQYSDFATWQRHQFQETYKAHLAYWQEHLQHTPATSQFPTDYPRPPSQQYNGADFSVVFNETLLNGLYAVCNSNNVTLFMLLLAAFQALLFRHTYQEDIVIGTPIANRSHVETESLIGFFVNTLPLRITLHDKLTFEQLLARVREVAAKAYTHQDVPFEKILEELKIERSLSISPLFQILFVLQNTPLSVNYEIEGKPLVPQVLTNSTTIFELVFAFSVHTQELFLNVQYNTALFTEATIRQIIQHYQSFLEAVVVQSNISLDALPLLGPDEQAQLLRDRNNTTRVYSQQPACVHELFELCVERNPQRIAINEETCMLTYSELNNRSNQLAHCLRDLGIGAESVVGICMDRSHEMVIGLLAILKAGGAYAPIDSSQPPERLKQIIDQTGMRLLVVSSDTLHALPQVACPFLALNQIDDQLARYSLYNPRTITTADNLCYVVHTSGSTGAPKGIAMTHRPLMNLLYWHEELAGNSRITNTLQFAPPIFDSLFLELFLTFLQGGILKIAPEEVLNDPERLLLYMSREKVERIYIPFVAFQQLALVARQMGLIPMSLREIMCGGEQLQSTPELRWWLDQMPQSRLWNTYGPSEAHEIMVFKLPANTNQWPVLPPLGYPNANTQIYLLDNQLRLVPTFVEGELYVGGECLSRGYLNQPDITAEHFIPNLFDSTGKRLYRTGDCGRYLPDGSIEFLGRRDSQIKIRGHRIELGEIEVVLRQHPLIRDCVVSVIGEQENKHIQAYIISNQIVPEKLKQIPLYLSNYLPSYMCPTSYILVESFPTGPTGKIDRRALDATYRNAVASNRSQEIVQPHNELELLLASIWCEVLHIENVGINENFFELGGHSLLAIQLALRLREDMQLQIGMRLLFEYPTIAQLADFIIAREIAEADEELVATLLQDIDNA